MRPTARLLRLALLAPDLAEAILFGRQPKGLQLQDLLQPWPLVWEEQRHWMQHSRSIERPLADEDRSVSPGAHPL